MTLKITATAQYTLSDEWLSDVLITAFDINYGGCWYWCGPNPQMDSPWEIRGDGIWQAVNIVESDGAFPRISRVTVHTIAHGTAQLMQKATPLAETVRRAVINDDAGEIDADAADAIVQYGLFGRRVYG